MHRTHDSQRRSVELPPYLVPKLSVVKSYEMSSPKGLGLTRIIPPVASLLMTGTFVPLPLLPLPPTSGEVLILFYFSLFCAVPAVMWKFRNHKVLLVGPIWRMIARETKRDRVEETDTEQLFDLLLKFSGNALLYIHLQSQS
jgi:hypothetical protein